MAEVSAPARSCDAARRHGAWLLVAALASVVAACGRTAPDEPGTAIVTRVVDGDTVVVDLGGHSEKVRLLGVDTPETVDPKRPPECFGKEASAHLSDVLPEGTEVNLVRDVEARDRYGRLLAYIYRADDELFVNLDLVAGGYAEVLIIAPNGAFSDELTGAQSAARAAGIGMWSACPHQ